MSDVQLLHISSETLRKHREWQRKDTLRHARERYRYKDDRMRHDGGPAPFIMWDGEGPQDAGYALFGNSAGYEICHPFLSTRECLELIYETERDNPRAIHIGFGFNYDVSMILKDLPWRYLTGLHHWNKIVWEEWEIEHIPHKWFKVKRGQVVATIYDVRSFFMTSYVGALLAHEIGTDADIAHLRSGKAGRSQFMWADIDEIREYWRLELRLGPLLMDKLRRTFDDAGYRPRQWHGPGALARMALRRHHIYDAMAKTPYDVGLAARYAFAGGRFELFKAGHVNGPVHVADIRSAYPYFATFLPNLARGKWRKGKGYEPGKFAVYHIRYEGRPRWDTPHPLFKRMPGNEVCWPYRVEGWYWTPEASLVAGDPRAVFIESWVFDEDNPADRPFAWLADYYHKRDVLKRAGNPAQYTFKLIINSVYGQLAQRTGWDRRNRRAPKSHQLEWAGYITSACRAMVYRIAIQCGDKLVSIDTDGISSLSPFGGLDIGNHLGQWEVTEYTDGVFWQSGIYTLQDADGWSKARTRGIPKGSYKAENLLTCLENNTPLELQKTVFVGYGLADNGRHQDHNKWLTQPHTYVMGGGGKRSHQDCAISRCDGMHTLLMDQSEHGPEGDPWSKRHYLPWIDSTYEKREFDDILAFETDQLDIDPSLWDNRQ